MFAESQIFKIFDVNWIAGNTEETLENPNEVILSVEWMKKFFGLNREEAHQALGRIVNIGGKKDLAVIGVYEDFPETTDFPFKMMVSYETLDGFSNYYGGGKSWHSVSSTTNCMVLLDADTDPLTIERQFPDLIDKYIGSGRSQHLAFKLQPLADVHFNQKLYNYPSRTVNYQVLLALAIIGLILVVTACINFINLATAQAIKRSKEIGIRKVMGGYRFQLIVQFMSETFIITLLSVIASLGVAELLMVNLTDVLSYRLHLDLLSEPGFIFFLIVLVIFVGFLSGFYPSFLLSRINPVKALKSKLTAASTGGYSLRRALVIFQFGISQLLIICTLIVSSQMEYFRSKDLGFEREGIILTYLPNNDKQSLERLKDGLSSQPEIVNVSFGISAPLGLSDAYGNFNYVPANVEEDLHGNFKYVDENYIDLYHLKVLAGRKLLANDSNNVLVNMEVVKFMGFDDPEDAIGESMNNPAAELTGYRAYRYYSSSNWPK